MTLVVVLICLAAAAVSTGLGPFYDAATFDTTIDQTPALVLLGFVATMNVFVLVLNLVPPFRSTAVGSRDRSPGG